MAAHDSNSVPNITGWPHLVLENLFLTVSTPTFIQLIKSSKELRDFAIHHRPVLLHHLRRIPGDKADLVNTQRSNEFLLHRLGQRAANCLYGVNFTANMTEYLVKDVTLVPGACAISGLEADYVRMALVFKNNADIRQYTAECVIKERITQVPALKIIKLTQWQRYVSVLCRMSKDDPEDESLDEDTHDSNPESDTDADVGDRLHSILRPTAHHRLMRQHYRDNECKIGRKKRLAPCKTTYLICHYDIYTLEDSQTYEIEGYLDYTPRDLAVHSQRCCAVLWDKDTPDGRPTKHATLMCYSASQQQLYYPVTYDARKLWLKDKSGSRRSSNASDVNTSSDNDDLPDRLATGIEFFKNGERLKIYDTGGVVPFNIVNVRSVDYDSYAATNVLDFLDCSFHVDTPFFGTHVRYTASEDTDKCVRTHLCLGVATLDLADESDWEEKETRVLCILRSQTKSYSEDCKHNIDLQKMHHIGSNNATVVARLWGFEEMHTSLTGKNVVAISPGGTRIAIAMWNKVYVYALNPKVLCDEVVVDEADDDNVKRKKRNKTKRPWERRATDYYDRVKDTNIMDFNIAILEPIVLDLEGAVAHKMNWSASTGIITDTAAVEEVPIVEPSTSTIEATANITTETIGTAGEESVPESEHSAVPVDDTDPVVETENAQDFAPEDVITDVAHVGEISQVVPITVSGEHVHATGLTSTKTQNAVKDPSMQEPNLLTTNPTEPQTTLTEKSLNDHATSSAPMPAKLSPRKKEYGIGFTSTEEDALPKQMPIFLHPKMPATLELISPNPGMIEIDEKELLPNVHPQNQTGSQAEISQPVSTSKELGSSTVTDQEEDKPCNDSKDTQLVAGSPVRRESESPSVDANTNDEADTTPIHKKRVTEDELIILTDRGIQIWNLGARAKRVRIKKHLKLEEPLRDLLPRWQLNGGRLAWPPPEDDEETAEVKRID